MNKEGLASIAALLFIFLLNVYGKVSDRIEERRHRKDEESRRENFEQDAARQERQIDLLAEIVSTMNNHNYITMQPYEILGFTQAEWNLLPKSEQDDLIDERKWVTIPSKRDNKLLIVGENAPSNQVSLKEYQEGVK